MSHPIRWSSIFVAFAVFTTGLSSAETPQEKAEAMRKLADGLNYQQGHIVLKEGLAAVNVPEDFRYLSPADAEIVLHKIWGNPPGDGGLGMLLPAKVSPADDDSWAVVLTYREDGYVSDKDAATIDYDKLLKQMQEGTHEANKERKAQGYDELELLGWAKPPRYDASSHKLYWAKELKAESASVNTLNYDIRMLGRRGVLELNAISAISQLPEIDNAIPSLLSMVDFQDGNRYADFNPKTDKVATYGLAALIAGGVLAKAGFFKALIPILIAGKKFVLIAIAAIAGFFKKLFGKKSEESLRQ